VLLGQIIKYKDGTTTSLPLHSKKPFDNLVTYILNNKQQALVFCTTRNMAESTAKKLSRTVAKKITPEDVKALQKAAENILRSGEVTKQAKELAELVRKGISFHHAGLNTQQRRIIEETFKEGSIKILTATPTLAAGVNLPARYVIIKSIYRYDVTFGSRPIPVLEFKQQSGRAGRPQYDTRGDAIVIAKTDYEAEELFDRYILADTEDIESRIATEPALRRIVLGQIATGNTQNLEELLDFLSDTFYGYHSDPVNLMAIINEVINYLREQGLITQDPDYLIPTNFGKRVSELYIDPMSAVIIRDGLIEAQSKAKKLLTDLSILHLVCSTPDVRFVTVRKNDFEEFFKIINNRQDEFLLPLPATPFELELFMSQLKTALVVLEWTNETPEDLIIERYNVGSGDIHMIVSNAEWILYSTSELAKLLGYTEIANKARILQQRVIHGIREDLLELVQLPGIGRVRARNLFDYGIKSPKDIIDTSPEELCKIPGIGTEIVRNIYTHLLGKEKTQEILGELSTQETENKTEDKQYGQKTLEDFLK
ncbi:MAG: helicase-related protein, partial [Candidatus Heimdallarchaeaceae archaeon]